MDMKVINSLEYTKILKGYASTFYKEEMGRNKDI